jgi:hypothetical protein
MATSEQIAAKGGKYKTATVVGEDNVAKEINLSDAEIEAKVDKEIEHEAWIAANEYKMKRQYPSLNEQLDMLFKDIAANKVSTDGELYKALAKVKSDNPKPE